MMFSDDEQIFSWNCAMICHIIVSPCTICQRAGVAISRDLRVAMQLPSQIAAHSCHLVLMPNCDWAQHTTARSGTSRIWARIGGHETCQQIQQLQELPSSSQAWLAGTSIMLFNDFPRNFHEFEHFQACHGSRHQTNLMARCEGWPPGIQPTHQTLWMDTDGWILTPLRWLHSGSAHRGRNPWDPMGLGIGRCQLSPSWTAQRKSQGAMEALVLDGNWDHLGPPVVTTLVLILGHDLMTWMIWGYPHDWMDTSIWGLFENVVSKWINTILGNVKGEDYDTPWYFLGYPIFRQTQFEMFCPAFVIDPMGHALDEVIHDVTPQSYSET